MAPTKWFNGKKMNPFHVGIYECMNRVGYRAYAFWDGKHWGMMSGSIMRAVAIKKTQSCTQSPYRFRGVVK